MGPYKHFDDKVSPISLAAGSAKVDARVPTPFVTGLASDGAEKPGGRLLLLRLTPPP